MQATVFNHGRSPVTYDSFGRVMGSQEWTQVDLNDPETARLVSIGLLIVMPGEAQ